MKLTAKLKKISTIYTKKSKLNNEISSALLEIASEMGINKILFETSQEYDDNNYYTEQKIRSIKVEAEELLDMEIQSYHLDDEFQQAFEEVEKVVPANSIRFIKDSNNRIDCLTNEDVGDITFGKLALYCLKKGINMDDMASFLTEVLDAYPEAVPSEWTE